MAVMSDTDARTSIHQTLSDFPKDLVVRICDFLPDVEVLRLGCTCKRLYSLLLRDDSIWKDRCYARWMLPAANSHGIPNAASWKHLSFEGNGWAVKRLMASCLNVLPGELIDGVLHYMRFEYSPQAGVCFVYRDFRGCCATSPGCFVGNFPEQYSIAHEVSQFECG